MIIDACGATHKGNLRKNNEDNIYVDGIFRTDLSRDNIMLKSMRDSGVHTFAVFDGLGGEAFGEQASLIAALGLKAVEDRGTVKDIATYISAAHQAIIRESERRDARNMGTTAAAVCIDGGTAEAFNVGDSRVYLMRGESLRQLSRDHSVTQLLIENGLLREEERRSSRYAGELTQYIGMQSDEDLEPAAHRAKLAAEPGDIFLVCSDGLTGELSDEEIRELLEAGREESAEYLSARLVEKAVDKGARDNISAVVCCVKSV